MKLDSRGFLYAEVLILMVVMSVIFSTGAIAGRNFLLNAAADFEATKLIASLRYVQELNRNSYVVREGEFKKIEPKNSTLFIIDIDDNSYKIKSTPLKFEIRDYTAIKNITYKATSSFGSGIIFNIDGNPKRFGSIEVKSKFLKNNANRYVIIDKVGRVRMDRILQ